MRAIFTGILITVAASLQLAGSEFQATQEGLVKRVENLDAARELLQSELQSQKERLNVLEAGISKLGKEKVDFKLLDNAVKFGETQPLDGTGARTHPINVPVAEYELGIVGFRAEDGDINEDEKIDPIIVWPLEVKGEANWQIEVDFASDGPHEKWIVRWMAIRRGLLCK